MLRVFYSNHLENLVDSLVETVRQEKARTHQSAFEPVRVIVPNWNLETFLKLQIAERTGLAAALEFERLERFMASLVPEDSSVELLTAELLQSLTLDALSDPGFLSQEGLAPVHGFIFAAGDDQDAVARRRFQLASRLADLFREYSYSREDMLASWRAGERVIEEKSFASAERWQRLIWLELFGEGGRLSRLAAAQDTDYVRITEILDYFDAEQLEMPSFVHLFGISYVANAYERIFWELGRDRQLYIYSLNPCRELWEDVVGNPDEEESLLSSKSVRGGRLDFSGESSFWEPEKHPPALRLWGRAGRDNARMLNRLCSYNFEERWADFTPESTLEHLQHDILTLEPERDEPHPGLDDDSIQILACPSIEREVEIISDEIWALVRGKRDTWGDEDIDFNDIAVIVNHEMREAYQTQIESVFRNAHDIPFNIIDVEATHHSKLVEALELLFELPFGKFRRRDLLELMTHPNVVASYPDADADQWVEWCDALQIVHGADHSDHDDTYIEEDILNWDQGMRRLALGSFMAGEPSGEDAIFEHGDFDYLPFEIAEDEVDAAAQFVAAARALIADARACRGRNRPLSEWCELMTEMLDTYVSSARDEDDYEMMRARGLLLDVAELDLTERDVPYRIAYEFVAEKLAGLEVQRGSYLTDGVVVSSFLPMRPIPFEAVFVTGMGEGKFPTADTRDPLDLRLAKWQEGDVYKRDQDKYMFLETLISTRERFYMTYVARDSRTGDPLEPASTVREMQFMLEQGYLGREGMKRNIVDHPLRRFDERYFDDDSLPTPIYPEARREAGVRAIQQNLEAYCHEQDLEFPTQETLSEAAAADTWDRLSTRLDVYPTPGEPEQDDEAREVSVSLRHLSTFLVSPLQGYAQYVLGLRRDDEENLLAVDDENFASAFLDELGLLRDVFDDVTRGQPLSTIDGFGDAYDQLSHRKKLHGTLPSGLFGTGERPEHLEVLDTWLHNLAMLGFREDAPLDRKRIGRADEFTDIDDVLDSLSLRVETSRGPLDVEIYGETNLIDLDSSTGSLPGSLYLMSGSSMKGRYVLNGFFDYVAMVASGVLVNPEGFRAASNPRRRLDPNRRGKKYDPTTYVTRLGPLSQQRAREFLEQLAGEMFGRAHDYLMPFEAVLDWGDPDEDRTLSELVLYHRDDAWDDPSSQYGPIHDWRAFEPPEDAEELANARFSLLFELMQEGEDE